MTDFRTRTEIEENKQISVEENEKRLLKWAIKYISGMGVPSTVHYTEISGAQNNVEEWAVPLSILPTVLEELCIALEEAT